MSTPIPLLSGMIGYGMAKAAVHQLIKSLSAKNGGLPSDATTVGILPWVKPCNLWFNLLGNIV